MRQVLARNLAQQQSVADRVPATTGSTHSKSEMIRAAFLPGTQPGSQGLRGVWWLATPRWRWLIGALALPMLVALVAMNYHFVSDVIAGSVLGGVVGAYAALLGRVESA